MSATVGNPSTGEIFVDDFEGGPKPSWAFFGGKLTGTIAAPGFGLNQGTNDATDPTLPSNIEVGMPYTGGDAFWDVGRLTSWVWSYNLGRKVTYSFLPIGGYNSNSFAYTLDSQLGLTNYFGLPSGWIPGWGKLVPGL